MAEQALAGKKAIVTGGGRGIGRAIAVAFAEAGADVAVIGRTAELLEETAAAVRAHGQTAGLKTADLTDVGSIPGVFEELAQGLGGFDILVNSAGVQLTAPALDVSEQDWDATLDANLKALFFCCQAAAAILSRRARARSSISHQRSAWSAFLSSLHTAPPKAVSCNSRGHWRWSGPPTA